MKLFISISLILILSSCTLERYSLAHSQLKNKKYALAINNYDRYIKMSKNGAIKTIAEMERAEAYYQTGLKAFKLKKWELAARFFFLANTKIADSILDDCYWNLAKEERLKNNNSKALEYYNIIVSYFPNSNKMADVLLERIKINFEKKNTEIKIWNDYKTICNNNFEHTIQLEAETYANKIIPKLIDSSQYIADNISSENALQQFENLRKYPSKYKREISDKIANIYVKLAENKIAEKNYIKADEYFKSAIKNNPSLKAKIKLKQNNLVNLFMKKGDSLLKKRKIDEAIKNYSKIFEIIPDNSKAIQAISNAKIKQKNIASADTLFKIAKTFENRKKFKNALIKYKESYKLDSLEKTKRHIFIVSNIIRAKKEPVKFAKEIILHYKNGIFEKKTRKIISELKLKYPKQVKIGNLKFYLSVGEFNYEVRYDITTPKENYFLIWQIDLSTQAVIPLNKLTEKIFGK
jgi:tetratricopeptide (TPR) repeat protein